MDWSDALPLIVSVFVGVLGGEATAAFITAKSTRKQAEKDQIRQDIRGAHAALSSLRKVCRKLGLARKPDMSNLEPMERSDDLDSAVALLPDDAAVKACRKYAETALAFAAHSDDLSANQEEQDYRDAVAALRKIRP